MHALYTATYSPKARFTLPVSRAVSTARDTGVKNDTCIYGPWTRVVCIPSYTRVTNTARGHLCHFLTPVSTGRPVNTARGHG